MKNITKEEFLEFAEEWRDNPPKSNEMKELVKCSYDEFLDFRIDYTHRFGFAIITKEFLDDCVSFLKEKKVLEVMSGSGYLAHLLQNNGIDIIPTDNKKYAKSNFFNQWSNEYTEIEEIDAIEAIEKYHNTIDILLLSWPPYEDDTAYIIAERCYKYNIPILYIGELEYGCCADDDFFDFLECAEESSILQENFVRFIGIYDNPLLYTFKKEGE